MKIAILGAQGTGKTQLTRSLAQALPDSYSLADSPPLLHAVNSDLHDPNRYADALAQQREFDLTLLMGLDLAWQPGGLLHYPAQTRERFDARLRAALHGEGLSYAVVYGSGAARTACALQAIAHHAGQLGAPPHEEQRKPVWQWPCEKCSDAACEHRLFTEHLKIGSRPTTT